MCFNKEMSLTFAVVGLFLSVWTYTKTNNLQLAIGIFYFFLMEFLQYFQYMVINDCENPWNQILTLLGYIHICYQPYFTHVLNSSLTKSKRVLWMYVPILRLCLIGGSLLLARYFTAEWWPRQQFGDNACTATSPEWLRGEKLCTFSGKYHLAWSVPMSDVSYYVPSSAIHSFLMFAPFLVLKANMIVQGLFLFFTGPFLAAYITPNLFEQASIWCFFSISQIAIMLFVVRDLFLVKKSDRKVDSVAEAKAPYLHLTFLWPTGVIDPAEKAAASAKKAAKAK